MANYTGTRCIICSRQFTEDDDIVVCPECGTPYHRECYKKEGKCVNTALHESKRSWKPSYDTGDSAENYTDKSICRRCGMQNSPRALFCERCGFPMSALEEHNEFIRVQTASIRGDSNTETDEYNRNTNGIPGMEIQPFLINFSDPLCGYNPDEDFDGVRLCELGDFVENNTHYYLPNFKRIKESGRAITWNFSAMLFPELYFAYRKMPLISLAALLVRFLSNLPNYIAVLSQMNITYLSELAQKVDLRSSAFQGMNFMSYVLTYGLMFFFGAFANWIYYKHAVKKTAKIKSAVPPQFWRQTLRSKGGTSIGLLILAMILAIIPISVIYFFSGFGTFLQL